MEPNSGTVEVKGKILGNPKIDIPGADFGFMPQVIEKKMISIERIVKNSILRKQLFMKNSL